ncbi:MAG: hypothetical protein IPK23_14295 [Rhizobiales bacterium]|nr:hypothetical protein [Hyphomicrobiales bacterium]
MSVAEEVGFDTEHPVAAQLPVIASLQTADETVEVSATDVTPAVADVTTEVETGPVEHGCRSGLVVRLLLANRNVSSRNRSRDEQRCKGNTREQEFFHCDHP